MGADEIEIGEGPFVVYMGTHGDRGAPPSRQRRCKRERPVPRPLPRSRDLDARRGGLLRSCRRAFRLLDWPDSFDDLFHLRSELPHDLLGCLVQSGRDLVAAERRILTLIP